MSGHRNYDDRDGWIWLNGKLVPWREANTHVLTHALHYASSVFEGQRAYGGEIFKLTEHNVRLRRSGELLGFEIPWSVEELDEAAREVLRVNNLTDAYMRPVAWRGPEQMGISANLTKIHVAIAAWPWVSEWTEDGMRKGLRLGISPWRRPPPYCAPVESKASGLYMICTMARQATRAQGYDDAMMLDWRGQIAEATGANIFFVKDGALHTPEPDCFLNGITRQTVFDLARRRGIEVIERKIWPEDLEGFEQCFFTGTAAELTPVREAGPWNFEVGALTLGLRQDYMNLVNRRTNV